MWKRANLILLCLICLITGILSGAAWSFHRTLKTAFPEIRILKSSPRMMTGANGIVDTYAASIPDGAHFVASGKGKYFYSIFEPSAKNLWRNNRIFFQTAEEAVQAGYRRRR
jgi:hypothetical protein